MVLIFKVLEESRYVVFFFVEIGTYSSELKVTLAENMCSMCIAHYLINPRV